MADIADGVRAIDASRLPSKAFQAGVGPYGEPQLVRALAAHLNTLPAYGKKAQTKRKPDLLITGLWAVEVKLARPFGDNGKEAENWSVNLLHPYEGNTSVIGDCLKLQKYGGPERRAAFVIGYEHTPPRIPLEPLFRAFEIVVTNVNGVRIGERCMTTVDGLVHPVHQQVRVVAWEVLATRQGEGRANV